MTVCENRILSSFPQPAILRISKWLMGYIRHVWWRHCEPCLTANGLLYVVFNGEVVCDSDRNIIDFTIIESSNQLNLYSLQRMFIFLQYFWSSVNFCVKIRTLWVFYSTTFASDHNSLENTSLMSFKWSKISPLRNWIKRNRIPSLYKIRSYLVNSTV